MGILSFFKGEKKEEKIENKFSYDKNPFADEIVESVLDSEKEKTSEEEVIDFKEEKVSKEPEQMPLEEEVKTYTPSRTKKTQEKIENVVEKKDSAFDEPQKNIYKREIKQEKKIIRKKIYIEFIIDGTYSFISVFPKVFYIIETMMKQLKWKKVEYPDIEMQYGLTIFHEDAVSKMFPNGTYFTGSEEEFLDALRNITFYGGSADGKENLTLALDQGMCVLQNAGGLDAERGLFFFSDSMPKNGEMTPDFTKLDQAGYRNKGVRFAEFYTYTEKFMPKMWMINGDGVFDEEGINEARMYKLQDFLEGDLDAASKNVEDSLKRILNQCSVYKNR